MKHFIAVLFIIFFITVNGSLHAGDSGSAGDCAKGDTAYKKLDNRAALEFYKKALETDAKKLRSGMEVGQSLCGCGRTIA